MRTVIRSYLPPRKAPQRGRSAACNLRDRPKRVGTPRSSPFEGNLMRGFWNLRTLRPPNPITRFFFTL
ncbi:Hypothetical protein FKW44_014881 [Caligus rogercresseyi]|uniref:Uncharacterized protein n=1 Tax=Caligus rogercresseyi TaxID=217165 RepID=A0A7T8K014_CALRO|nr:Hypothetical protein FKW44_014881 [Caligus rogercresseyi]